MKKIVSFLLIGLFLQQVALHATGDQLSCGQKFVVNTLIFFGYPQQDVYNMGVEHALSGKRALLNYCEKRKIGSYYGKGLNGAPKDIIDGKLATSGGSPTSVADRKNLKFKQS